MNRSRVASLVAAVSVVAALGSARASGDEPVRFALRDVGHTAGEPTLGVLPDGSIVYQALTSVLRTTDDGKTWRVVHRAVTGDNTKDPYLHVDAQTGRIWSSQLWGPPQSPGGECQVVSISDDAGERWLEDAQCGTVDHQKIGSGPWPAGSGSPLYPRLVYTCSNRVVDSACAISLDGGVTWGPQTTVFPGIDLEATDTVDGVPGLCGGLTGDPVSGPDGTIYVPRESCGRPFVAMSADAGVTWTHRWVAHPSATRPVAAGANNPAIAVDPGGTLFYAWTGDDWRHRVARSGDGGDTWQVVFTSEPGSTTFPGIITGRSGAVATMWVGTSDTTAGPDGASAAARWHLHVAYSLDANAAVPVWQTVQVTPAEDPVMIGCLGRHGLTCSNNVLLDFNDMALTADGRLAISYTDACFPQLCSSAGSSRRRDGFLAVQSDGPRFR